VTPRAPRRRRTAEPDPAPALRREIGLAELGLDAGDRVRFRRRDGEHWKDGTVVRRESDGSLGVRDAKGAMRALPLDLVEVRATGPRGGVVWEPVPERAARTEQMGLF
jgi:hypothetical protein